MKKILSIVIIFLLLCTFMPKTIAQTQPIAGDINADGQVSLSDVILIAKCCIGSITPSSQQTSAADIDSSSSITLADTILAAKMAIGELNPEQADIYVLASTQRLTLHEKPAYTIDKTLRIETAKNEAESVQFTIYSNTRTYQNLNISCSTLSDGNGNTIPVNNIKLSSEYYSKTKWGPDLPEAEEAKAYLLFPMKYEEYNNISTQPKENTTYQIDITADADTLAGTYTGTVTLKHNNGTIALPLEVTVWDFTLPQIPTYRSLWGFWTSDIITRLQCDFGSPEYIKAVEEAFEIADDYKFNLMTPQPEVIGAWSNTEEYVKNLAEYIKTHPHYTAFTFMLHYSLKSGTTSWDPQAEIYLSDKDKQKNLELIALFEKYGILDNAYIYQIDEPHTDAQFRNMHIIGDFLKENGLNEKVHNLVTAAPRLKSAGSTNTWCPIVSYFDPEEANKTRSEDGSDYWWYFCNDAPWPTFGKDVELSNTRMNAWFAKRYDIKGILYWIANAQGWDGGADTESVYHTDRSPITLGREGDGVLNKNLSVPSLSCTALRDATEDFDYLVLLENRIQEYLDKTKIPLTLEEAMDAYYSALANDTDDFATYESPQNIPVMRRHIAQTILNGVDYIMTEKLLAADGRYNKKEICIYVEKGTNVNLSDHAQLLSKQEYDLYDVYTYLYTFTDKCEFINLQINDNIYTRPMSMWLKIEDNGVNLLDLNRPDALQMLKQANPHFTDSLEIIEKDSVKTIKYTTNSKEDFILYIPKELFNSIDWPLYSHVGITVSTDGADGIFTLQASSKRTTVEYSNFQLFTRKRKIVSSLLPDAGDDFTKNILYLEVVPPDEQERTIYISDICLFNLS